MSAIKGQKGQVTVFIALIVPVIFMLLAFAIDFGTLVDAKIRLQIAADRAVYAGAAHLAYLMNEIAEENWGIYKAFLKVEKNFGPNSQQSISECKGRVREMENADNTALQNIGNMLVNGYREANQIAEAVAQANFEGVGYEVLYGEPDKKMFEAVDMASKPPENGGAVDEEGDEIRRDIICGNIEGVLVFDPTGQKSENNEQLLKYTYKDPDHVGLIARLTKDFVAPLAGNIFGSIEISAIAAAQPYGGSIKRFSFLAKDREDLKTIEQVREYVTGEAMDKGLALWYRPALVPVMLEAVFADLGLEEDEETYLQ